MSVTTAARLDTARLAVELGADVWTSGAAPTSPGSKVVTSTVSDAALQAAITAHVFVDLAANESTLASQVGTDMAVLRTSVDTLQAIVDKTNASIGPADTKQIARECRRLARQLIALTRLVTGDTSSTDTGSA